MNNNLDKLMFLPEFFFCFLSGMHCWFMGYVFKIFFQVIPNHGILDVLEPVFPLFFLGEQFQMPYCHEFLFCHFLWSPLMILFFLLMFFFPFLQFSPLFFG